MSAIFTGPTFTGPTGAFVRIHKSSTRDQK